MRYYKLTYNSEPKVVGVTHGAGQAALDTNFLEKHPWFKAVFHDTKLAGREWWKPWAKPTEFAQSLSGIKMEKKAKHTDFINFPRFMRGFMVNTKLREILEKACLPNHKFLDATFNQNGKLIDNYWWFVYDLEIGEHTVDFKKSEFDYTEHEDICSKELVIENYQDYMNIFYVSGKPLLATKLFFNKNFNKNLDILETQFLAGGRPYISERLLEKWEKEKISGYIARSPDEVASHAKRFNDNYCELIFE